MEESDWWGSRMPVEYVSFTPTSKHGRFGPNIRTQSVQLLD